MFISLNGYGGVRKRIGHLRGGRFDLCCSHCGEWQWRGDEKGEGEKNESVAFSLHSERIPNTESDNPDVIECFIEELGATRHSTSLGLAQD